MAGVCGPVVKRRHVRPPKRIPPLETPPAAPLQASPGDEDVPQEAVKQAIPRCSTLRVVNEISAVNPFAGKPVPDLPLPQRPILHSRTSISTQVRRLQAYISEFQYNFLPRTFFNCSKDRPLTRILDTAREVMKECLPIRCLEATFLAIALTQGLPLDRIPLSFKTVFNRETFRHIVLTVRHDSAGWGCMGLSRKADLMYKPLGSCATLSALVGQFKASYEKYHHEVQLIKIGLPISHDSLSTLIPCWKFFTLNLTKSTPEEVAAALDQYASIAPRLASDYEKMSRLPRRVTGRLRTAPLRGGESENDVSEFSGEDQEDSTAGGVSCNSSPGGVLSDDDDDADTEENAAVLSLILQNKSPFRRSQQTALASILSPRTGGT